MKEWQIFTASICNGTWVLLSAEHKIRDVHFSIGGGSQMKLVPASLGGDIHSTKGEMHS